MILLTTRDGSPEKKQTKRGRTLLLVVGILLLILGVASVVGGGAIIFLNQGTDSEGYALSNVYRVDTSTYAFTLQMDSLKFESLYAQLANQIFGTEAIAQTKWLVKSLNSSKEIFVGYATVSDGNNYLDGMESEGPYPHWRWTTGPYYANVAITSTTIYGEGLGGPTRSPAAESFWLTSAHSNDVSVVYFVPVWGSQDDDHCLIIMNLDGSKGVEADIQLGFKVPILGWLPYLLIPLGITLCISGIFLIRRRKRLKIDPSSPQTLPLFLTLTHTRERKRLNFNKHTHEKRR